MKIAQVVPLYESVPPKAKNGLEFVVSWLTEELVKRGHEVTLFASADSVTKSKLVSLLPVSISQNPKNDWEKYTLSIWNTIIAGSRADEFDIIHCHNGNGSYIAPFVSCPIVETIHNPNDGKLHEQYLSDPAYAKTLKPILENMSKLNYVTVSKNQEQSFLINKPAYFKNHQTIHNGIPVDDFEFSLEPEDYLVFIGFINKNKGADVAVRIAKNLNMKLILAGHKDDEDKFFDEHIAPFLNERIQYVGPVDFEQKNTLYKNALAKLAPLQWDEPFGLTLVEAQACGTPVMAFNKGAASEVINNGKTGFVMENEEEMIEAIKNIGNIKRADCRAWVEENFSIKKMVDEYESLYRKLA